MAVRPFRSQRVQCLLGGKFSLQTAFECETQTEQAPAYFFSSTFGAGTSGGLGGGLDGALTGGLTTEAGGGEGGGGV